MNNSNQGLVETGNKRTFQHGEGLFFKLAAKVMISFYVSIIIRNLLKDIYFDYVHKLCL